jgi:hypothetical protein
MLKYIKEKEFYFLVILWLALIVIVNPAGNFPIGDDFSYAGPVKHYLQTGQLKITDWSSMTLIAHLYFGIIITYIFGFSFNALRAVSLIAGLFGVVGSYSVMRELDISKRDSLIAALLVAFNPWYYFMSYTYGTDITFFAFFVWSLLYYVKCLKYDNNFMLIYAVILNIIALLIRDLAIIIPAAFAIGYLFRNGLSKKNIFIILLVCLFIAAAFFAHRYWYEYINGATKSMEFSRKKMLAVWTSGIPYLLLIYTKNTLYTIIYFGLFLAPVALIIYLNKPGLIPIKYIKYLLITVVLAIPVILLILRFVPKAYIGLSTLLVSHSFIHNYLFADLKNPSYDYVFIIPSSVIIAFTIFGLTVGIMLIYYLLIKLIDYLKNYNYKIFTKRDGIGEILVFTFLFYMLIIFSQIIVGRYLLPPMFLMTAILLIGTNTSKLRSRTAEIAVLAFLLFNIWNSVGGTHDMMEYNRTNEKAFSYLKNVLHVPPDKIDGGFEYNAWNFYDYNFKPALGKNWWWVHDDEYKVCWGRCDSYDVIKEYTYTHWLPPCFKSKVSVMKRK